MLCSSTQWTDFHKHILVKALTKKKKKKISTHKNGRKLKHDTVMLLSKEIYNKCYGIAIKIKQKVFISSSKYKNTQLFEKQIQHTHMIQCCSNYFYTHSNSTTNILCPNKTWICVVRHRKIPLHISSVQD